ncbi:MAG: prolipoprotein diacylglyceryl transferase [Alphaproteobacteria bacterium]|nr:prolipoprotein diacylglyceryl transferase [Alphaproteobacteria bacterium SS10]
MALEYPTIDPVALDLGVIQIRWYALAYIAGFLAGWRYVVVLANRRAKLLGLNPKLEVDRAFMRPSADQIADLVSWMIIGVILGGRLGYVLFYQPAYFLEHPLEIIQVWRGGMAFHGGLLGAIVSIILFARRQGIPMMVLGDFVAAAAPIGLCLGRVANFINGELYGRVATDVPWAMVFPGGGPDPRHPSQLYQASLEGLALFIIMAVLALFPQVMRRPGIMAGVFLTGYGIARSISEVFREPDPQLGFLFAEVTMGQLLSVPMILLGIALTIWAARQPAQMTAKAPDAKAATPGAKLADQPSK